MSTVRMILGEHGTIAQSLPGYESREPQLSMADAVQKAIENERVLLCEAGTGTGKTLAYLVPAILSRKKTVISTATKALQEQIAYKDIPLLAQHAKLKVEVAVMKGLSNYVCRRRLAEFRTSVEGARPAFRRSLRIVNAWMSDTDTGDLAELTELAETDPVRFEISSSSDTRIGADCQYFRECFVTQMKRQAEKAQVVVVNHHLLLADLALRDPSHQASVIPRHDVLICDEAHQLEDVATTFFSTRISSSRLDHFVRDAERAFQASRGDKKPWSNGDPFALVDTVRRAYAALFTQVTSLTGNDAARASIEVDAWPVEVVQALHSLDAAVEAVEKSAELNSRSEAIEAIMVRASMLRADIHTVLRKNTENVSWIDLGTRSVAMGVSPVEVSSVLREKLFESTPSVVLTSATLATAGGFAFLRSRMGLSANDMPIDELLLASPFDYERNALLYVPKDLPDVNDASYLDFAAQRATDLTECSQGGAFVLCTSIRAMRAIHERMLSYGVEQLFMQGDAPKTALLSRFRAAGNATLVATMGFWEGVDVPGHALRLVIIDRIPFPVPSDPVIAARSRAIEEAGHSSFQRLSVPNAVISLKQGFGRLIRTKQDRGVVAILDRRVISRSYGAAFLRALPPARCTHALGDVAEFFQQMNSPLPAAVATR